MNAKYSIYDPRFYDKESTVEEVFQTLEGRFDDTYDKPVPLKRMENVQPYKNNHQYEGIIGELCILSLARYTSISKLSKDHNIGNESFRQYLHKWCDYHNYEHVAKVGQGIKIFKIREDGTYG